MAKAPPTPPPWHNWESLGGGLTSIPSVGYNKDGRLEVFAIGLDKKLYHIWQNKPNGNWPGGWQPLGGTNLVSRPAVGHNKDGRLEVFSIWDDGDIHHIWQDKPNGKWPGGWKSLGGSPNTWPGPAVSRNEDGRLEVFSVRTDKKLYHIWQDVPNGNWPGGWQSLDGIQVDGGPSAALEPTYGRLQVFVRGLVDQNLYWSSQDVPNGQWPSGLSNWNMNINHNEPQSTTYYYFRRNGTLFVVLAVFIFASDGNNWYQQQTIPSSGPPYWSGQWSIVGNSPMNSVPEAATNADGHLEVFVTKWQGGSPNFGELYHTWQL